MCRARKAGAENVLACWSPRPTATWVFAEAVEGTSISATTRPQVIFVVIRIGPLTPIQVACRTPGARNRPRAYRPGGSLSTHPDVERVSAVQRDPPIRRPLVSKRSPATISQAWPALAKIVAHLPGPGLPQLMNEVESSGPFR